MTTQYFQKTWCDGPECHEFKLFKENSIDNPSWWNLTHWTWADDGDSRLLTDHLDLDFCSPKCLEAWCVQQRTKEAA